MIDQKEKVQLDKAWMTIVSVWSALLGSLGVYVLIAMIMADKLTPVEGIPFDLMKNILFGVSVLVFITAFVVRKTLLGIAVTNAPVMVRQEPSTEAQPPAAGKYIVAIIAASGLSESIGICGLVFFFLSKDSAALYQFITISALAMFVCRPRKDELLQFAADMQRRAGSAPSGR
jgi:hypothetical protein